MAVCLDRKRTAHGGPTPGRESRLAAPADKRKPSQFHKEKPLR
jgi:hypothetical protein